jgi:thiol-disulfide isomerase/thioredoxin
LAGLRQSLVFAVVVFVLAGCGSGGEDNAGGHPDYAKALAGAPPPLAALHRQSNELLDGGTEAYEARIAALRGYPVVVNVWASWCGPCRSEFRSYQQASAKYGKRVGFLGIDRQDSDDFAREFLEQRPVPYPSYKDPEEKIASSIGAGLGIPDTAFYSRDGKLVYLKQGPYTNSSELEADLRRYALGS